MMANHTTSRSISICKAVRQLCRVLCFLEIDQHLPEWISSEGDTVLNTSGETKENIIFLQAAPANLTIIPFKVAERRPEDVTLYYGMPTVRTNGQYSCCMPHIKCRNLQLLIRLAPRSLLGQASNFTESSTIQGQKPRTRVSMMEQTCCRSHCRKT